jgi:hypothetical protein
VAAHVAGLAGLPGAPAGCGPLLAAAALFPEPAEPARRARPPAPARPDNFPPAPPGGIGWILPWALGAAGVVLVVGVWAFRAAGRTAAGGRVRIVSVPPGEAPEYIRRAWVGLELPVAGGRAGPQTGGAFGVLSNQPMGYGPGYAVDGATAVRLLAAKDPDAAAWWRESAPHVLRGGYQLVFPADVCEPVA